MNTTASRTAPVNATKRGLRWAATTLPDILDAACLDGDEVVAVMVNQFSVTVQFGDRDAAVTAATRLRARKHIETADQGYVYEEWSRHDDLGGFAVRVTFHATQPEAVTA